MSQDKLEWKEKLSIHAFLIVQRYNQGQKRFKSPILLNLKILKFYFIYFYLILFEQMKLSGLNVQKLSTHTNHIYICTYLSNPSAMGKMWPKVSF